MALGIVPMCSYQMERMFNTTRIPGKEAGTATAPRVGLMGQSPLAPSWGPTMAGCLLPVRHLVALLSRGA